MIADPNTGQSSKQVLSSTKKGHIYIVPIGNPFVDKISLKLVDLPTINSILFGKLDLR